MAATVVHQCMWLPHRQWTARSRKGGSHYLKNMQVLEKVAMGGGWCDRGGRSMAKPADAHLTPSQEGLKADIWVFHVNASFHW